MGRSTTPAEDWHGWDAYAPFYDWENRRTQGRRNVRFRTDLVRRADGTVLELGCGTGRRALHRFSIAFRTMTVPQVAVKLEASGFRVDAVLGDYRGTEWSPDAEVWVIITRRAPLILPRVLIRRRRR